MRETIEPRAWFNDIVEQAVIALVHQAAVDDVADVADEPLLLVRHLRR